MTAAAPFFLTLILVQTPLFATAGAAPQTATTIPNFEERNRGIELYRQEKFAEASSVLRKAVKKNRTDDEAWYYLGLTLIHQKKDLKDASKAFQTALQLRANFAAAHAGLGYALLLRNKPSDAIREARAALSISTNLPNAYYIVGVVSLRAGATEEALQNAEAAIRVDSQFASAYLLKSQALVSFLATPPVSKIIEGREIVLSRYRGQQTRLKNTFK